MAEVSPSASLISFKLNFTSERGAMYISGETQAGLVHAFGLSTANREKNMARQLAAECFIAFLQGSKKKLLFFQANKAHCKFSEFEVKVDGGVVKG